jgi:hypothetical protein
MPLGNSLGEFVFKVLSVRQSDLGGDQRRIEGDYGGEVTGEAPGNHFGTLTVIVGSDDPTKPNPWTYTGTTLAHSGAVVGVSGSGIGQRTGEGHRVRLRGVARYSTADPKLSMLNHLIAAIEADLDPATMTLKGSACEWK